MVDIAIVLFLVVLNGLFALSELAIVSARRTRLQAMARAGKRGSNRALALASDPSRFLSTVQIGITLIGILAGAYSGATLGTELTDWLVAQGLAEPIADPLGYAVVVILITYLSLIIGELVPKTLALRNPEAIACAVAPAMTIISRFAAPAVWLLDRSTKAVLRLLGQSGQTGGTVTEEELRSLVAEAESAGIIETGERQMISGVMRLGDRAVLGIMTPRTDVDWVDVTDSEPAIRARLLSSRHSWLPAGDGSLDNIIGVVSSRELLAQCVAGQDIDARRRVLKAPVIPETVDALNVLSILREADVPMALIHDEYGHFEGLVTPTDVLEAIAGVFKADSEGRDPYEVERADGSWLLSGAMPADEMAERLAIALPPQRDYQTVAGFLLAQLRHMPSTGEIIETQGWTFEVLDLDGRRIDKILATRIPARRRVMTHQEDRRA